MHNLLGDDLKLVNAFDEASVLMSHRQPVCPISDPFDLVGFN